MEKINIDGIEIRYYTASTSTNKNGVKSAIGHDKNGEEYWIAYYPEEKCWEIERCMNSIDAWRDYAFSIERANRSLLKTLM